LTPTRGHHGRGEEEEEKLEGGGYLPVSSGMRWAPQPHRPLKKTTLHIRRGDGGVSPHTHWLSFSMLSDFVCCWEDPRCRVVNHFSFASSFIFPK
jgi:hypothetical protein